MTLSIPKLGLEDIVLPVAYSQVELDRESIIHLEEAGVPWEKGSNTVIVGYALGFLFTRMPCVFYWLEQLEPGDEIVKDRERKGYTFKVYDRTTVWPEEFWITCPVPDKTTISLQTCTPIPAF